jgi:hypothetical protein
MQSPAFLSRPMCYWMMCLDLCLHSSRGANSLPLKKTPWPQSASELYRPRDRRLSAKLVPIFLRIEGATWSAWRSLRPYSRLSRPELLLLLPSSSSVALPRLSGPRSRHTTFFFLQCWESSRDLQICSQKLCPLDHRGGREFLAISLTIHSS